tara:strand:+ start:2645 stop:4642 length:1998 start_codon:yes stop_codon:yes gene_type:complete
MAEAKKRIILEFDADTGQIVKGLDKVDGKLDDVGKKAGGVGKKGKKGFGMLGKGLNMGKLGFQALGKAIIATGIGALVLALVALGQQLMKNDKVARIVEQTMAAIGAVVSVLVDVVVQVGEALFTAFTQPQVAIDFINEKINTIWQIITGVGKLIKESFVLTLQTMKKWLIQAGIAAAEFFSAGFADTSGMEKALNETKAAIQETKDEIVEAAGQVAGPFIKAFKDAKKFVGDLTKEMSAQARLAIKLAESQRKLRDNIRTVALATAKARSEIAQMKMDSDNMNLSIEERIKAATAAAQKEEQLRAARQKNIEDGIRLVQQEMRIQGKSGKDNEELQQKLNDLKIEFYAIEEEGLALQTEMQNKIIGLQNERFDAEESFFNAQRDRKNAMKSDQEQEIEELRIYYAEQLALADQYGFDTKELLEQQQLEIAEMEARHQDERDAKEEADDAADLERERKKQQAILDTAKNALNALMALNEAFGGVSEQEKKANEKRLAAIDAASNAEEKNRLIQQHNKLLAEQNKAAKKQFDRGKKLQIAQATISMYESAVSSYNSLSGIPVVGPVLGGIAAAAAIAMGIANIGKIKATQFEGAPPLSNAGAGRTAPQGIAEGSQQAEGGGTGGMLDLGFLGEGATSNVQAFVISNEVTTTQQSDQLINDQASLVG